MANIVIQCEALGKRYIIGHKSPHSESYVALRDVVARGLRNWGRSLADIVRGRPNIVGDQLEEFWAIRDLSFEVHRGDVLGIIGHNGAGKSTLLKVLSRITEPSAGRVRINGRMATLLEVGTGFHPELSGRENIMLNGAILGMSRKEVRAKFDEIVDFAGVERFLDTPVKRYSSGMYVRLAFSVAAHLEPEILVVDEVLAVGDAEFQKKCLGKMQSVTRSGRTVLFVSHNMAALAAVCNRGLVMSKGGLIFDGSIDQAMQHYQASRGQAARAVALSPSVNLAILTAQTGSGFDRPTVNVSIELDLAEPKMVNELCLLVYSEAGARVGILDLRPALSLARRVPKGRCRIDIALDVAALVEQDYALGIYICADEVRGNFHDLAVLSVPPRPRVGSRYPIEHSGFVDFHRSTVGYLEAG